MHLVPALVAGCLALEASAFLVPLEVAKAAEQAKSELAALLATTGHNVDLECPGCPYFGEEDEPRDDIENKIHLELGVSPEHGLTINNLPIFASDPSRTTSTYIVSAPQIRIEDGHQSEPVQLDFAWERLPTIASADEPDKAILPLTFTILGLRGIPVKVDTLAIDLLQTPEQTSIARVLTIPFEDTPGATTCDPTSKWSLCRLRAFITVRLQTLMGAATARASTATEGWSIETAPTPKGKGCGRGHGKGPGFFGGRPPRGFRGRHGHGGPPHRGRHDAHHNHHLHHYFCHMLRQTLRFFVIPALLGMIGGLVASAIGMLVGQCISYLWIRFHRGGVRGSATGRDLHVVEVVIDEDEKDILLTLEEALEPPPEYRDVEPGMDEKA